MEIFLLVIIYSIIISQKCQQSIYPICNVWRDYVKWKMRLALWGGELMGCVIVLLQHNINTKDHSIYNDRPMQFMLCGKCNGLLVGWQ